MLSTFILSCTRQTWKKWEK